MLTRPQLQRLEVLWGEQKAPIADHLRPGLSIEEMHTIVAPLGINLPTEAETWWGWHDGVSRSGVDVIGGPHLRFISLVDAVAQYHASRAQAERAALEPGEADRIWHPSWFPISDTGAGGVVACDCSVAAGSPTPIRTVHWGHKENSDVPVADSFGQVVGWWITAIERGAWWYDADIGRWDRDQTRLADPSLELTRLL
jgi:cell wall assembly regulator SMI1